MHIRPYRPADNATLVRLDRAARRLPARLAAGGRAWVVAEGEDLPAYASLTPVPGLPGVFELDCFVAPGRRRCGLGTALLRHVIQAVSGTEVTQLSHPVSSLESAAVPFLKTHGFYLEHEEWHLELEDLDQLPPLSLPQACTLQTFARREAVDLFRTLYEQSFGGKAWYQPYTAAEIAAELDDAADLLFLVCEGEPAGFAWTRLERGNSGVIEPFGITSPFQGRGYGRFLLQAALHQLARRGARRVHLGLWRRNQAALALYRSLGFEQTGTRYYLALDL